MERCAQRSRRPARLVRGQSRQIARRGYRETHAEKSKNRYGEYTALLIEVPPGVTSVERLIELLLDQRLPSETPFVGIFVVGNFPITIDSAGGYRVIPIKPIASP